MREDNNSLGNPLINPVDDTTDVGDEISSFAYMETPIYRGFDILNDNQAAQLEEGRALQEYKESRNGWQRFWDTVGSAISNVTEGVTNFIDDIWDFSVTATSWVTGLVGGIGSAISGNGFEAGWEAGTSYVDDLTTYEWEPYLNNFWNQMNFGTQMLTGDMFTEDYWERWGDLGNNKYIEQLHAASFASDWGDFGQGVQKVEQGVGYILPSLVLAYFTGGSSLGAQAAIQGGVIGAAAMGGGVETALKEGATYGQAMGYGATKGIISGGITAATIGIGGSVLGQSASGAVGKLSGTVGSKVGQLTGSKGAEVFAAKATEALVRAGFSATNAFAQSMADPALKAIYDGGDAIAQAYGDNEKVKQTMMRAGNAALMSGATSLAVSAIREGGELAIRGRDGYMADYYSKQAALQQKALEKEIKSLNSDIEKGKNVDIEARMAKINKINERVESYGSKALDYVERLQVEAQENRDTRVGKSEVLEKGEEKVLNSDFGANKDVMQRFVNVAQRKQLTDFIRNSVGKGFTTNNGGTNDIPQITFSDDGQATIENPKDPTHPLQVITYKNEPAIIVESGTKFPVEAVVNGSIPQTIMLLGNDGNHFVIDGSLFKKFELIPITKNGFDTNDLIKIDDNTYEYPINGNKMIEFHQDGDGMFVGNVINENENTTAIAIRGSDDGLNGEVIDIKDTEPVEIPREYIIDSANLNNDKVFAWKNTVDTIKAIAKDFREISGFGDKAKVEFSGKSLIKAENDLFNLINKRKVTAEEVAKGIENLFRGITVKAPKGLRIEGGKEKGIITYGEILDDNPTLSMELKALVEKHLVDLLRSGKDSVKVKNEKRIEALKEIFKEVKGKLQSYGKEMKDRIAPNRTLRGLKRTLPKRLNVNLEKTEDNLSYRMGSLMVSPFMKLKSMSTGYSSGKLSDGTLFSNSLDDILNYYSPERWEGENAPLFPYSPELRDMIQQLRDSLTFSEYTAKDGSIKIRYPALTAEQTRLVNKIIKNIEGLSNKAVTNYDEQIRPSIINAKTNITTQASHKFTQFMTTNPYAFNAASSYAVVNGILGYSKLAYDFNVGMNIADSNRKSFIGKNARTIESKIKELGIAKILSKNVEFHGAKVQYDYLVDLYGQLNSVGFEKFNSNGLNIYKKDRLYATMVEKGHAQETLDELESFLPDGVKKYAKWLLEEFYVETTNDYVEIEKAKGMVEVPVVTKGKYWPSDVYNENATSQSVEAMVRAPRTFGHDIERVTHDHPFQVHSATMRAMQYVQDLGTEKYVRPLYQDIRHVLNFHKKGETTVYQSIKDVNPKFAKYLTTTLNMWMGVSPTGKGKGGAVINYLMKNYTYSLLSFNVGTPLKQPISIFFSNYSLGKVLKAGVNRVFRTKAYKDEYNYLVKDIGSMQYRTRGSEDINVDLSTGFGKILYVMNKVAEVGMTPIKIFDNQTIKTGLVASMNLALDSGYKLGTDEFRVFTTEMFAEFLMTQIGSNPSNLSALARGDSMLGQIGQYISFMQGPARAALAAFIDKINTANYVKGWTQESVDKALEEAIAKVDETKGVLSDKEEIEAKAQEKLQEAIDSGEDEDVIDDLKEDVNNAHEETESAREDYQKAQAEKTQAEQNKHTWAKFKSMGGKLWGVSTLVSIVLGSALVALIQDFNKKVKGQRQWDTFDIKSMTEDALWYGASGWLPVANTITNALKGYDSSYPAGAILNDVTSLISSISNAVKNGFDDKSLKALLREGITTLSTLTGIPFKNLYNIVYGAIKTFNPELAFKLNNLFYYTSPSYSTTTFNELIQSGEYDYAKGYLSYTMATYKGMTNSDLVNGELIELAKKGYTTLPKNYMTAYQDENGNTINLGAQEQEAFKNYYSRATYDVQALISSMEYKSLDDEYKSKMIKKIYDSYYEYGKSKVIPNYKGSKIINLLSVTNGGIKLNKLFIQSNKISLIQGSEKESRKSLVLKYVNSLKGYSKQEKLLILWLNGYSLSDKNKVILGNYLIQSGGNKKDVKEMLKGN